MCYNKLIIFLFEKKMEKFKKLNKLRGLPGLHVKKEREKNSGSDKELNKSTSGTTISLCLFSYPSLSWHCIFTE